MDAVFDTVSVKQLVNCISRDSLTTSIDAFLRERILQLRVDADGALIDEWARSCGLTIIQPLVSQWNDWGAVVVTRPVTKLPTPVRGKLRKLGFTQTIDKLVLRIALASTDKRVVSEDSDFWDPADVKSPGNHRAVVATICRDCLGITVLILSMLIAELEGSETR